MLYVEVQNWSQPKAQRKKQHIGLSYNEERKEKRKKRKTKEKPKELGSKDPWREKALKIHKEKKGRPSWPKSVSQKKPGEIGLGSQKIPESGDL